MSVWDVASRKKSIDRHLKVTFKSRKARWSGCLPERAILGWNNGGILRLSTSNLVVSQIRIFLREGKWTEGEATLWFLVWGLLEKKKNFAQCLRTTFCPACHSAGGMWSSNFRTTPRHHGLVLKFVRTTSRLCQEGRTWSWYFRTIFCRLNVALVGMWFRYTGIISGSETFLVSRSNIPRLFLILLFINEIVTENCIKIETERERRRLDCTNSRKILPKFFQTFSFGFIGSVFLHLRCTKSRTTNPFLRLAEVLDWILWILLEMLRAAVCSVRGIYFKAFKIPQIVWLLTIATFYQ